RRGGRGYESSQLGSVRAEQRDAVLLALLLHLVLEEPVDQYVPVLVVVEARLSEGALQLEAVAEERVLAQTVVRVGLRLDPADPEALQRVEDHQTPRLDAPAVAQRVGIGDHDLEEGVAVEEVDVEQPDEAGRRSTPSDGNDGGVELTAVPEQEVEEEVIATMIQVLILIEEVAAHHRVDERAIGPLGKARHVRAGERAEAHPLAVGKDPGHRG